VANIIDLFAGAGGISLGAARAGFDLAAAVELDKFAVDTHAKNFPAAIHLMTDVGTLTGRQLLELSGLKEGALDGLVGGPPCQGFSAMGKRNIDDPRNNLFNHFFRLVNECRPAFFLAENVPGILDEQYDEIRKTAFKNLEGTDYVLLPPIRVKASDYGVPTIRTRIFFIGFDPSRFKSSLELSDFLPSSDLQTIHVAKALEGLPVFIDSDWQSEASGWRRVKTSLTGYFFDRILNSVPKGMGHLPSIERYFENSEVSGCMGTRHTQPVIDRFSNLQCGEVDKISRAIRLSPTGFCPTLRAGTASDRGSFQAVRPIHHIDPRVITAREAARLQGFPDWFVFQPTKWHSFRQIGNSVSPLVSEHILKAIYSKLN
jgi:DNA (cytosine-5)-methyltransferase 1